MFGGWADTGQQNMIDFTAGCMYVCTYGKQTMNLDWKAAGGMRTTHAGGDK